MAQKQIIELLIYKRRRSLIGELKKEGWSFEDIASIMFMQNKKPHKSTIARNVSRK